jgi:hypothetical protein
VDEMVLPTMKSKLKKTILKIPDSESDLPVIEKLKQISIMLDHMKQGPEKQLKHLDSYLTVLQTTFDKM